MMDEMSPVCLFTYNRLSETKRTIQSLKNNYLAELTDIYIFSDAAKTVSERGAVCEVRKYIRSVSGFRSVKIIERQVNLGLANSIIDGVSQVIEKYGSAIVLEDDLVSSRNFLNYMNLALKFYQGNNRIWSISGFSFPMRRLCGYAQDGAFGVRASSWGWATWKEQWEKVDWQVADYAIFMDDKRAQNRFNRGGSDLCKMLRDQMAGTIDSWAIRFCYAQFRNEAYDLYPTVSKVKNIGFGSDATNTQWMGSRFDTTLDVSNKINFSFSDKVQLDNALVKEFRRPFSVYSRLKYKLLRVVK